MSERRRWMFRIGALVILLAILSCRKLTPAHSNAARIISLSPNTTETLFALGVGDRLVGRSRFCDYPPEVRNIPSVGGYVDASLEAILALAPDLVVGARGPAGPGLAEKLGAMGIATFFPPTESMAEIDAMIEELGKRASVPDRAEEVVAKLRARRAAVARAVAGEPRARVLLVFGTSPIVVAGPGSFPDEMVRLANAENVVKTGSGYPTLNVERLMTFSPDVVVNASMTGTPDDQGNSIHRDDPGWRELAAVREGRIVVIHDEAVLRPGPRIGEGLAVLARALHPSVSVP